MLLLLGDPVLFSPWVCLCVSLCVPCVCALVHDCVFSASPVGAFYAPPPSILIEVLRVCAPSPLVGDRDSGHASSSKPAVLTDEAKGDVSVSSDANAARGNGGSGGGSGSSSSAGTGSLDTVLHRALRCVFLAVSVGPMRLYGSCLLCPLPCNVVAVGTRPVGALRCQTRHCRCLVPLPSPLSVPLAGLGFHSALLFGWTGVSFCSPFHVFHEGWSSC